jgi:hypothetical protein
MTPLGWTFLVASLAFVWGLTIWCYGKVLAAPEPPPEEVEHFHSA